MFKVDVSGVGASNIQSLVAFSNSDPTDTYQETLQSIGGGVESADPILLTSSGVNSYLSDADHAIIFQSLDLNAIGEPAVYQLTTPDDEMKREIRALDPKGEALGLIRRTS